MDADFIILSPDCHGLAEQNVRANFCKEKFYRETDDETETIIKQTWQNRHKENPRIFNGSKFRFHQIDWTVVENQRKDFKMPIFCLGLTSYRDYLGTNCSDQVANLHNKGLHKFNNTQAFLSDALGVGTFLLTTDDQFVFLKRSQYCSEAQGLLDGPGGHPEPDMIEGIFEKSSAAIPSELIVKELFDSIIREVVDEVNIPRCQLEEAMLLGLTKNHTTGGRISAEFLIKCRLSSKEVLDLFNEGTQSEAEESTAILFRSQADIISASDTQSWVEYAPATKARIRMYNILCKRNNNE